MMIFDFTWEGFPLFWSMVVAGLCGVTCSILGCFLLVKKLSLLGDGIGHGVLPGIALAVLFTGEISSVYVTLGAMAFGVLTAVITERLASVGKISEDASLGIVFTTLFALGVLIISRFLYRVHVDSDSALFGLFEGVTTRTFLTPFGGEIPRVIPSLLTIFLLTVGLVTLFWKEWILVAFDAPLAKSMGFSPTWMNYLLVGLVAGCIVASFEAVGSILVLAMLVVPAATAYLLSERMPSMVFVSAACSLTASIFGCWLASRPGYSLNTPGTIAVTAGAQFVLAVILAPRQGIVARSWRRLQLSIEIAREEILGALYRLEEAGKTGYPLVEKDHGLSPLVLWLAQRQLLRRKYIEQNEDGCFLLTAKGRKLAQRVVRNHRIMEHFAGKVLVLPADHVHAPAARLDHFVGPQLIKEISRSLDSPNEDPHGKQIPVDESTPTPF